MIEVYHVFPSRSLRVMWLLEELGLDYKLRPLTWPVRENNPEYLSLSPAGTFPAMIEGEGLLLESMAMCELIARRHGGGLMVAPDSRDYPRYLQWLWFGEATLLPQLANVMRYGSHMPQPMQIPRAVEDAAEAFAARLVALEKGLGERAFILGEAFSLADISIGYALFLADRVLGLGERLFGVRPYWERLAARPAFSAALARAQ